MSARATFVDQVLGPTIMGVCLSAFFYGLSFVQFCHYIMRVFRDTLPPSARLLVLWTFLVDTVFTGCLWWMTWVCFIDNFENIDLVFDVPWPAVATPIFVCAVSGPIQLFYGYQCVALIRAPRSFFFVIASLAVGSCSTGIMSSVLAITRGTTDFKILMPMVAPWLTLSVVCDLVISACLAYYMPRAGLRFLEQKQLWRRIVEVFIETPLFPPVWAVATLIVYVGLPDTNYCVILGIPLGRVYTASILTKLNEHLKQCEDEADGVLESYSNQSQQGRLQWAAAVLDNLSDWSPAEVRVNVTVQERVDVALQDMSTTSRPRKPTDHSSPTSSYLDQKSRDILA